MYENLPTFKEDDGVLVPIEFSKLPFTPKRIFYVCNVPEYEERGNHAHYQTEQLLICVKGKIKVKLHNGYHPYEKTLHPHEFCHVKSMVWDSQVFLTGDDVLLSICSTEYDKNDYIEDFDRFLSLVKEMANKNEDPIIHFNV